MKKHCSFHKLTIILWNKFKAGAVFPKKVTYLSLIYFNGICAWNQATQGVVNQIAHSNQKQLKIECG
jgi:hypothetical protein